MMRTPRRAAARALGPQLGWHGQTSLPVLCAGRWCHRAGSELTAPTNPPAGCRRHTTSRPRGRGSQKIAPRILPAWQGGIKRGNDGLLDRAPLFRAPPRGRTTSRAGVSLRLIEQHASYLCRAAARWRSSASINAWMSPSSTPWVLDVVTPVRASLTRCSG